MKLLLMVYLWASEKTGRPRSWGFTKDARPRSSMPTVSSVRACVRRRSHLLLGVALPSQPQASSPAKSFRCKAQWLWEITPNDA
ncbi:hypothetical protein LZ31DRAFT_362429 [Colletotrichum somersetense]|nr:hypothetical protein LZ31DRAFT_362429 [Colletotrichum somersetense]